ncbi:TOBE domain-containing protein [Tritonibacter mobilis]|uniref:TOBE domain-containing protein n=1 Tax=Tritonibacter mobilis TaxID=379347 RepID=UPI00080681FD|nr:molybdopterin-binding protein [Tritonibacter mobilis]GLP88524.1 transporter [Tritonibacter mobilis]SDX81678.1 molybdenum-pterin binding domain-containing protein [Tritonibacter mobilis]
MKISARNKLAGTVVGIEKGSVNSTVQIDLGGAVIVTAMITNASVEEMGLEIGKTAYAIVKALDVMVGAD